MARDLNLKVMAFIENKGGVATNVEITDYIEANYPKSVSSVSSVLTGLVNKGKLSRSGRGKYVLPLSPLSNLKDKVSEVLKNTNVTADDLGKMSQNDQNEFLSIRSKLSSLL